MKKYGPVTTYEPGEEPPGFKLNLPHESAEDREYFVRIKAGPFCPFNGGRCGQERCALWIHDHHCCAIAILPQCVSKNTAATDRLATAYKERTEML